MNIETNIHEMKKMQQICEMANGNTFLFSICFVTYIVHRAHMNECKENCIFLSLTGKTAKPIHIK